MKARPAMAHPPKAKAPPAASTPSTPPRRLHGKQPDVTQLNHLKHDLRAPTIGRRFQVATTAVIREMPWQKKRQQQVTVFVWLSISPGKLLEKAMGKNIYGLFLTFVLDGRELE